MGTMTKGTDAKKQKKDAEKEKENEKDGESVDAELLTRINIAVAAKIAGTS